MDVVPVDIDIVPVVDIATCIGVGEGAGCLPLTRPAAENLAPPWTKI